MRFGTALQRILTNRQFRIYGSILFFALMASGLLIFQAAQPQIFERLRMHVVDIATPLLDVATIATGTISEVAETASGIFYLEEENANLRTENDQLIRWRHEIRELKAENQILRTLLKVVPEDVAHSVTARIVGDSNSTFVRSLLINAGDSDGIRPNMAAMTGKGLAGRVISTGRNAARVLLLTDLNSRIPVLVGPGREPAILVGNNFKLPSLRYLQHPGNIPPRSIVVTSGQSGVFPHGLPIGEVTNPQKVFRSLDAPDTPDTAEPSTSLGILTTAIFVKPFADLRKVEFLHLIDRGPNDSAVSAADNP